MRSSLEEGGPGRMDTGTKMVVVRLSGHFRARWRRRIGGQCPDVDQVNAMLAEAARVSRFETLYRRERGRFVKVKRLGIYWMPVLNAIVWVDEDKATAVTVISDTSCRKGSGGSNGREDRNKHGWINKQERHEADIEG